MALGLIYFDAPAIEEGNAATFLVIDSKRLLYSFSYVSKMSIRSKGGFGFQLSEF